MQIVARAQQFIQDLTDFPVLPTAATLWERFRQDRLGLTASALTFTTMLALVPFFAVVASVFTAFPIFAKFREALESWLVNSLIPPSISANVLDYMTQFATKASELGAVGLVVLFVTALSLVLTIDHTLNDIWRVTTHRPLGQRILVYWAALTLGPLVLGGSLAITSYVLTASRGWLPNIGGGANLALSTTQFLLMTFGVTLLYRFVPNTPVKWRHALAGGLFVAVCLGVAKWGLGLYLSRVPTYSLIYGAFATVPILLLWIHLSWLIVLFGAVIAAYLPSLLTGVARRGGGPGWEFQLATEVLQALARERET
ncbi:MAG: YihY family inner membrane protein, partial [Ottowia sp.]|nr:YihY family inner membrane protein [Ottowia sp.]